MFHRFAVLIAGIALAAGSVAPARVAPGAVESVKPTALAMNEKLPSAIPPAVLEPKADTPAQPEATVEPFEPAEPVEAEAPKVSRSASLAEKVAKLRGAVPGSRELECLAVGIYFESKSESLAGQHAVGQVIANRASSKRFPSSYCGVLFQRSQFSFIRGGRWPAVNKGGMQWKNAVAVAKIVDGALHTSAVPKALFFHARRVSPGWKLTRVGTIGNHVFYR